MKLIHRLAVVAVSLAGVGAFAATQGTLGTTSTGTYTNTFGAAVLRQVQILNVSDALITPDSGEVLEYYDAYKRIGVVDRFCVVDTTGGAVTLTFTGNYDDTAWIATAADGKTFRYYVNTGVTGEPMQRVSTGARAYTVPSGKTVTSAAACGAGNMQKLAARGDIAPIAGTSYVSLVTMVATPV